MKGRSKQVKTVGKCYPKSGTVLLGLTVVKKLFYLNNFFYQQKCNCLTPAGRVVGKTVKQKDTIQRQP